MCVLVLFIFIQLAWLQKLDSKHRRRARDARESNCFPYRKLGEAIKNYCFPCYSHILIVVTRTFTHCETYFFFSWSCTSIMYIWHLFLSRNLRSISINYMIGEKQRERKNILKIDKLIIVYMTCTARGQPEWLN